MTSRFSALLLAAFAGALALSGSALATPAKEAPWLPEAAAYRLTLFLGNLEPLPWDDVEAAWSEPHRNSDFSFGALARLDEDSDVKPDTLMDAISSEDRHAVFAEATRLIALRLEEELDRAIAAESPATAQRAVREARELYRAFADGIAAADPKASRRIGRAWLELASSAGSPGLLGAGTTPTSTEAMATARAVISDYLADNYLLDTFTTRRTLSALPETAVLSGRSVEVPPSLPPGSDIFDQDPLPLLVLNFEEQGIDETDLPLVAYGDMLFDSAQIFGSPARDIGIACSTCHNRSDVNQRLFIPGASHQPGAIDVDGAFFNPIFNDRRDDPIDIPSLRGLRFTGPMLTADGRLTSAAPETARRGEAIFNRPFAGLGDRSCASCHVPDANFLDRQAHDIGSVAQVYEGARAGALDTPTLLGTVYTAPYFHDGSLPTLAAVVDWFDETKSLGLTEADRDDLTAYLEAVGAADEPYEAFGSENTAFRLAFSELTTFASTLDTLIPQRDAEHILLLVDTVAADLAADAGTMSNLAARPDVYALAEGLEEVGAAVRDEDWAAAEANWSAFKSDANAIDERAF